MLYKVLYISCKSQFEAYTPEMSRTPHNSYDVMQDIIYVVVHLCTCVSLGVTHTYFFTSWDISFSLVLWREIEEEQLFCSLESSSSFFKYILCVSCRTLRTQGYNNNTGNISIRRNISTFSTFCEPVKEHHIFSIQCKAVPIMGSFLPEVADTLLPDLSIPPGCFSNFLTFCKQ